MKPNPFDRLRSTPGTSMQVRRIASFTCGYFSLFVLSKDKPATTLASKIVGIKSLMRIFGIDLIQQCCMFAFARQNGCDDEWFTAHMQHIATCVKKEKWLRACASSLRHAVVLDTLRQTPLNEDTIGVIAEYI